MRKLAAKPRIAALVIAFIGYVLTFVNYRTVWNERNYYPMLMLFGPVCILFGIVGAVEPRMMNPSGVQAGRATMLFRTMLLVIVLCGMAIGWAMAHCWYHIPGW